MTLDELNHMAEAEARAALRECCGSTAWVEAMLARRPFADEEELQKVAEEIWWKLSEKDWREAFAGHPLIGAGGAQSNWSRQEQAGMSDARRETRRALENCNRAYFEKFGYIYIVCASGKTAEEMLDILNARLRNDSATEIRVAAAEQSKITCLRLQKMLSD